MVGREPTCAPGAELDEPPVVSGARMGERGYKQRNVSSVFDLPGFTRDFDCFDSENEWDGKVVFVGF